MAGATASGASGDIMDYALRGALVPIYGEKAENGGFSDFPEIAKRFSPSAFININLYGTYYGLPVQQEWDMLFYRTDVLAALELSLPETQALLSRAGYTLSHSFLFDIIVEGCIRKGVFNVLDVNELLFAYDQPLLGS